MKLTRICFCAMILGIVGCEKSDETVFVFIDGQPLTAAQVKNYVLVRAKKAELSGRPIPAGEFVAWANSEAMRMVPSMINVRLMEAEIARSGVKVKPEDGKKTLADVNRQCGQQAKTIEELAERFGDVKETFLQQYNFVQQLSAYSREKWEVDLPDEFVSQYILVKTNELLKAEKIDATARKKAEAAYARLQAGEKWELVADACSEDKLTSPGNVGLAKEWCWMTEDALGLKPLARELGEMKVGEYTKPLDTKAGMLIVKLLEKNGRLYRVSRMMFRMAEPVAVPESIEAARALLTDKMFQSRRSETLTRLYDAARFEYPLGTNFCYKIWKETK